jgi:hypothetical protein
LSANVAPIVVAVLALLFTVVSFWWLHARKGSLKFYEPQSFATCVMPHLAVIRLPLIIYNSGARPLVVQDMRLCFPKEPKSGVPLAWRSTRQQLKPVEGDVQSLPAGFSVPGTRCLVA